MKIKLTGTNLVVNGETVADGGSCEVGDAEAKALIDRQPHDGREEDAGDAGADADRRAQILAAIRDLLEADPDRADESAWTKSGKPDVKALESLIGSPVSAAERDAAWHEVSADSGEAE